MTQLNLAPNDQAPKNDGKKSIGVLSAAILAITAFLIIGGLFYGANKVFDFSQNIKSGDYQKSLQNIIFQNANVNSFAKNINNSSGGENQFDIMLEPKGTKTNSAQGSPCSDSDAHLKPNDIYIKGVIKDFRGKEVSADQCADSRFVMEKECQPDMNGGMSYGVSGTRHECLGGCYDGACRK